MPSLEELQALVKATLREPLPPQNISSVAGYRETVTRLRAAGVEVLVITGSSYRAQGLQCLEQEVHLQPTP